MPTSTPDQRQKLCSYCSTPALPLATKCDNCGSALPMAMPRPVAQVIEVPANWRLRKTGFVALGVSALFGALTAVSGFWVVLLMLFWAVFVAPGMLMISAWTNAFRKDGTLLGNTLMAIGFWLLSLFTIVVFGAGLTSFL